LAAVRRGPWLKAIEITNIATAFVVLPRCSPCSPRLPILHDCPFPTRSLDSSQARLQLINSILPSCDSKVGATASKRSNG